MSSSRAISGKRWFFLHQLKIPMVLVLVYAGGKERRLWNSSDLRPALPSSKEWGEYLLRGIYMVWGKIFVGTHEREVQTSRRIECHFHLTCAQGWLKVHYNVWNHTFKYEKNWAPGMHLWDSKRAGIHIRDFWSFWMEQSIWVFTCVATGNNQTNVLIKYFR